MKVRPIERLTDFAIAAFLWAFRIAVVLVVVIGSILTLASGKYSLDTWIDLVGSGLTLGSIYALIALGYTMVYGILRMINFAHGDIFMVSTYLALAGAAIPLVEQNANAALEVAHRAYILETGAITLSGPPPHCATTPRCWRPIGGELKTVVRVRMMK